MPFEALLVEVDDRTARVLTQLLESIGLNVQIASTSAAAIISLQHLPALVILNFANPDGCGLHVLDHMRKSNAKYQIAILSGVDRAHLPQVIALSHLAIFATPLNVKDFMDWISVIFTESRYP